MITIHENGWYHAIGFVPPSKDPNAESKMELFAQIFRERNEDGEFGPLQMVYRFRYHNQESKNPWDKKDEKSWYSFQENKITGTLEERVEKITDAMKMLLAMTSVRNGGVETYLIEVPEPKDSKAFMNTIQNLPFMHTKTMTAAELKEYEKSTAEELEEKNFFANFKEDPKLDNEFKQAKKRTW